MNIDTRQRVGVAIICIVLIAVSGALFYKTFLFPSPIGTFSSSYGSAFFPRIMLGLVALCSLGLLVRIFIGRGEVNSSEGARINCTQFVRVGAVWLILVGFYWAWKSLGFLYGSPLFMVGLALVLGERRIIGLVCLAAAGPLVYVIFRQLLQVSL